MNLHAESTRDLFEKFVIPTYGRFPLRLARGRGARVWDEDGVEYLDFGAGIAVCSVGHCHPRVAEAMARQLGQLIHTSNLYYTRPQGILAKRLVELIGEPGKVFFCNSGAEANEGLYKLARKFGNEALPPMPSHTVGELVEPENHRFQIITFTGSFHGRTLAGISATGNEKVKKGFEPMVDGFVQVPFNDASALLAAMSPRTAAVLVEPVQGESGIHPATAHFLQTVRSICDDHGALLLFDEIQCGLGRTGEWAGWRAIAPGVVPDGVSWAKGIAGGFPLGAFWVRDKTVALKSGADVSLADLLGPGSHGTTFGGTPLVCTGALETLAVIEEEGLLENAKTLGDYVKKTLAEMRLPLVREIRGVGLMLGIELAPDFADFVALDGRAPSLWMVDRLHEARLLTVPSGTHALRWLPPLNVTRAEIDEAIAILRGVLERAAVPR